MNNTPPTAKNEKKSGFPFFWLLPLAAIALSGWLIIDTVSRSGIEIYITFEDASGLEPGKTDIRYNGVKVGKVKDLEIKEDLSGVTVKAELSRSAASIAREGAEFWIVRPNFSLAGISGIETLISGNFISVTAGEGEETKTFQGLEEEPPSDPNSPELYVILESTLAPAVVEGSPVLFRGAPIGEVVQTGFDHDRFMSTVEIRIADHCRGYVRKNSVFWDSSGLNIQFDLNSSTIKLDIQST
ncbi:MAG: MlaD family protein [Verrucomicrobiota bacterium]